MASLAPESEGIAGESDSGPVVNDESCDSLDSASSGAVRRPMNAFLIFCKHHRSIVKEKYPHLENRSITKILGEWWANLESEEKATYTDLAKQYKEAFMKANPDFKWYKLPTAPVRTLITRPSNQRPPKNDHESKNDNVKSIVPGKLADESQLGGLSSLLSPSNSEKCAEQAIQMSKPPKKRYLQKMQHGGNLHSNAPLDNGWSDATINHHVVNPDSKLSSNLSDKTSSACSALLKLAEMCSSKEYSQVDESAVNVQQAKPTYEYNKNLYNKNSTSNDHLLEKHTHAPDSLTSHYHTNGTENGTLYLPEEESMKESDEPLDLCTEKVKKIKTSHIIDHFVNKFLGDSLCANLDPANSTSSFEKLRNNYSNKYDNVQTKTVNSQTPEAVIKSSKMRENKVFLHQNSTSSSIESSDSDVSENKSKMDVDQTSSSSSTSSRQWDDGGKSNSCDVKNSSVDSSSDVSTGEIVGAKVAKKPRVESGTIVCGASEVSQLFASFREAPSSKACDLFSKAISSVIDNAYDDQQEKKLSLQKLCKEQLRLSGGECGSSSSTVNNKDDLSECKKVQAVKSSVKKKDEVGRRKSPRSCKGKRYQELMSVGSTQSPKEKPNDNLSNCDKRSNTEEKQQHSPDRNSESPDSDKSPTINHSGKSNKFNLDEQIAALPKCSMQLFECRRLRKKHSSGGEETSQLFSCVDDRFNSDTDPLKDPDFRPSQGVIRRIRRHSESSNRISSNNLIDRSTIKSSKFKTGNFDLEAEIAAIPKCNINALNEKRNKRRNVSAPSGMSDYQEKRTSNNDASITELIVGSRKRKLRRRSITHLENLNSENDCVGNNCENASLVALAEVASTEKEKLQK